MRTRAEVAAFVNAQLGALPSAHHLNPPRQRGKEAWHYGRVELRALVDYLYGGPPASREEEILPAFDVASEEGEA